MTRCKLTENTMEIDRLIEKHKDAVYRQMVRVCGNHDDAEDTLADAMIAAWRAADQLLDPAHFRAWMTTIGSRICARTRIRERLTKTIAIQELEAHGLQIPSPIADPEQDLETKTLKACVSDAVASLPETYREVYLRREILGESAEAVGDSLNLSISAVKSRLHRARALVRESLDSNLDCA